MRKFQLKNLLLSAVLGVGMLLSSVPFSVDASVNYGDIPKGKTLEQLEVMSTKISRDKNPEYYSENTWEPGVYRMDIAKLPFDGKVYTDERKSSMANSHKEFIKLIEMTKGSDVNWVNVKYGMTVALDGVVHEGEPLTVEVKSKEKYDYLVAQENSNPGTKPENPGTKPENPETKPENPETKPENPIPQPTPISSNRIWGSNRYSTAIEISKDVVGNKLENVVLAYGLDFPDALSGSLIAKQYNAPILLVHKTAAQSKETLDYIKVNMNKNGKIIILGSSGAVSEDIVNDLRKNGFNNIERLGGRDRYETNRIINSKVNVPNGSDVIVAYSLDFADALAMSPISSIKNMPIFLTRKDSMELETLNAIKNINPKNIYIAGDSGVVSNGIENQLKSIANTVRLGGKDRYDTSLAIAKYFNLNTNTAVVSYGLDFPDALAGSLLANKYNAPIILVGREALRQKNFIDSSNIKNLKILGGNAIVSDDVVNTLKK